MIFSAGDAVSVEPRPTALYAASASESAANSWTSINGWSAPLLYTELAEEYEALTQGAAMADFGALCRYIVRGASAPEFLARMTTAPLKNLDIGESARGLILASSGAVVDLIDLSVLGEDLFLLTSARPHARRLQLAARGHEVSIEDITRKVAALAIIGPQAREVAAKAGLESGSENLASQTIVRGVETAVRPIHVGEQPGIEVIYPFEEALVIWERVRRTRLVRPAGLEAIDVLRLEGGAPRPGADFVSADDAVDLSVLRTPEALGLPHLAPLNRAWFNGRRALVDHQLSADRVVRPVAVEAEAIAPDARVFVNGQDVGCATSHAFSPRQKRIVAFVDIPAGAEKKPLEVETPLGGRAPARLAQTAEGAAADAFWASMVEATEKQR